MAQGGGKKQSPGGAEVVWAEGDRSQPRGKVHWMLAAASCSLSKESKAGSWEVRGGLGFMEPQSHRSMEPQNHRVREPQNQRSALAGKYLSKITKSNHQPPWPLNHDLLGDIKISLSLAGQL